MSAPFRIPRGQGGRTGGFTLIELAVVALILGVVVAAVGACLGGGIRVWDAARAFGTGEADAQLALATMQRDLRNAFPFATIPVAGTEDELRFPGTDRDGDPAAAEMGAIRYAWDRAAGSLVREFTPYPGGAPRREALVRGVRDLRYSYWTQAGTAVASVTSLPRRVEIRLVLGPAVRSEVPGDAGGGAVTLTCLVVRPVESTP